MPSANEVYTLRWHHLIWLFSLCCSSLKIEMSSKCLVPSGMINHQLLNEDSLMKDLCLLKIFISLPDAALPLMTSPCNLSIDILCVFIWTIMCFRSLETTSLSDWNKLISLEYVTCITEASSLLNLYLPYGKIYGRAKLMIIHNYFIITISP